MASKKTRSAFDRVIEADDLNHEINRALKDLFRFRHSTEDTERSSVVRPNHSPNLFGIDEPAPSGD